MSCVIALYSKISSAPQHFGSGFGAADGITRDWARRQGVIAAMKDVL